MNRNEFLARVRQASAAGRMFRPHLTPVPTSVGHSGVSSDRAESFVAEVRAIGGLAEIAADWDAARRAVLHWLNHYQPRSALCWQHETLDQLGIQDMLRTAEITRLDYGELAGLSPDEQRQRILSADIGLTGVDYAIAETGSLAVCARPGQERLASLLALVHVAVVRSSQILPDLFDLFEQLEQHELPSNLALISGPSKTGDIELELTTGIHGPGFWHVIVVRDGD